MGTYGRIIAAMVVSISLAPNVLSQQYVLNAYDGDEVPSPIKTVFVDLDAKAVLDEIITGQEGQILNKKALSVGRDSDTFLISAAMEGCYCDNSIVGKNRVKISILSAATRQLVYSYADSDLFIDTFEKMPNHRIYIHAESHSEPRRSLNGDYNLGAGFSFVLRNQRPLDYSYGLFDGVERFEYLKPLAPEMDIYRGNFGGESYVIKTSNNRRRIINILLLNSINIVIDTVLSDSISDRSHILAVTDTLLYDFNLNWEFYSKSLNKSFDENRIASHVRIYNVADFALIDSFAVADYPRGDYPDQSFDVADVVGPYIVYYFFGREGLTRYAPAMLFIFDTRTNEATWLRVGWR